MRIIRIEMSCQPPKKPGFYAELESHRIRLRVEVSLYWRCLELQQSGWQFTRGRTQTPIHVTTITNRCLPKSKYIYCRKKCSKTN